MKEGKRDCEFHNLDLDKSLNGIVGVGVHVGSEGGGQRMKRNLAACYMFSLLVKEELQ